MKHYSVKIFFFKYRYIFPFYGFVYALLSIAAEQKDSTIPLWLIYHTHQQSPSLINSYGISFCKHPIHFASHKIKIGTINCRTSELDAFIDSCLKSHVLPLPATVNYPSQVLSRELQLVWQAALRGQESYAHLIKNLDDCIAIYKTLKERDAHPELEYGIRIQSVWRIVEISSADKMALDAKCATLSNFGFVQLEYSTKIANEPFYKNVLTVHPFLSIKGLELWCQKEGLLFDHFERVRSH
jgi:hypothetical protein